MNDDDVMREKDYRPEPKVSAEDRVRTLAPKLNASPVIKMDAFSWKRPMIKQANEQAPAGQTKTTYRTPAVDPPPSESDLGSVMLRLTTLETALATANTIIARLDAASIDATAECNTDGTITVTVNLHL